MAFALERVSPFAHADKLWQSIKSGKGGSKSSSESFKEYSTSSPSESDSIPLPRTIKNVTKKVRQQDEKENQQRCKTRKNLSRSQTPRRVMQLFWRVTPRDFATRSCGSFKIVRD